MPRRNRNRSTHRRRHPLPQKQAPARNPSTETMAKSLVARGLAGPAILTGTPNPKDKP